MAFIDDDTVPKDRSNKKTIQEQKKSKDNRKRKIFDALLEKYEGSSGIAFDAPDRFLFLQRQLIIGDDNRATLEGRIGVLFSSLSTRPSGRL